MKSRRVVMISILSFLAGASPRAYAQTAPAEDGASQARDVAEPLADRVARIVDQLGSDSSALREAARARLKELPREALVLLREHLARARANGNADLDACLKEAIERLGGGQTTGPAPDGAATPSEDETDDGELAETARLVLPRGLGVTTFSRRETIANGTRTVEVRQEGKTTTFKRTGEGRITGHVTDADGAEVETFDFKDEAELKEKRPDLHTLWQGSGGFTLRIETGPARPAQPGDAGKPGEGAKQDADEIQREAQRLREETLRRRDELLRRMQRMEEEMRRELDEALRRHRDMLPDELKDALPPREEPAPPPSEPRDEDGGEDEY